MIRETPQEFLDILKSYVPDPQRPVGAARQEFSEFFAEFQPDERPAVEQVAIRDDCGVCGARCPSPCRIGPSSFSTAVVSLSDQRRTTWDSVPCSHGPRSPGSSRSLPVGAGANVPRTGRRCGCRVPLPCQPRLPPAPDYPGWHISGLYAVLDLLLTLRDRQLLMPPGVCHVADCRPGIWRGIGYYEQGQ